MARGAGGGECTPAAALVGDRDIGDTGRGVAGRTFGDDGGIGRKALVDGRLRADPALFLTDKARKDEVGRGVGIPNGEQCGRQRAFHIGGATPVEPAITTLDMVCAIGVELVVSRWDDIVVADQREGSIR